VKSTAPVRIVIAGGGTGGHLFPGIAVAREILTREPAALISFAGTSRGIEARVVPREGFALDLIRSAGLKGKSPVAVTRALAILPLSALDAWRIVSRRRPDVVVGVGGYSSGPVVLMAASRGTPTMVLEQNAVPGLTNRLLARVVDAAAVTYEDSLPQFGGKAFVSGNPVRPGFITDAVPDERKTSDVRVLIFGGSQGAHAINMAMVEAAPRLAAEGKRVLLTHHTGDRDLEMVRDAYRRAGLAARVEPFLDAMDVEMKRADLVVCRAGATTLAEITAAARPAILIPLPTATDDHQRRNAAALVAHGAAEVLDERQLSGETLANRLLALAASPHRRHELATGAARLARPDAARKIVDRIFELADRQGR
jgi:UDP-N-acetylglucosamine--N-acetylmuramyl-(pentapeptide) pyrophosphoryl-undecaprenol N-acetylglucosamine transferase